MWKLAAAIVFATAPLAEVGCLSSSSAPPTPKDAATGDDSGQPVPTEDGSVPTEAGPPPVDGSAAAEAGDAAPAGDAAVAMDASVFYSTGLGSGVIAHSAHFTLVTKTGMEPGGAGVHSSPSFKMISGATPPGTN